MNKRPDPKTVDRACYDALSVLGVQVKYGMGNLPIEEDFIGWIGLNQGVHPTFVRVNPNIGVHCISLMKMVGNAIGKKYRVGEYPTYSVFLGVTCPQVKQFIFETEADLLPEAARLAETIQHYGLPYLRSIASYKALLPGLLEGVDSLGGIPEKYAAALYLSGDVQGAFSFLNEQSAKFIEEGYVSAAETLNKLKFYIDNNVLV